MWLLLFLIFSSFTKVQSQITQVVTPTFSAPTPIYPNQSYSLPGTLPIQSYKSGSQSKIEESNRQAMKAMGYTPPPTQADIQAELERKKSQVFMISKQQQQINEIHLMLQEDLDPYPQFSSKELYLQNEIYFDNAFTTLRNMATNNDYDIAKAVFTVENAYHQNSLSYDSYLNEIDEIVKAIRKEVLKKGLDINIDYIANWGIREYFRKNITYDFEDFWGEHNWNNQFVSKVLQTGSGQCHSLPLLYAILAQKLDCKAWIAFSPEHSYIKFYDQNGRLMNYETTNGYVTSNSYVMGSGYILSEAVVTKSYMDTISLAQTLGYCFVDLAQGYRVKGGYSTGQFIFACTSETFKLFPKGNNIQAWLMRYSTLTSLLKLNMKHLGKSNIQDVLYNTELNKMYMLLIQIDTKLSELGFQPMPEEAYKSWLKSVNIQESKLLEESLNNQISE